MCIVQAPGRLQERRRSCKTIVVFAVGGYKLRHDWGKQRIMEALNLEERR